MGEWSVQVSARVSPQRRTELEQCAGREKRTLSIGVAVRAIQGGWFHHSPPEILDLPLIREAEAPQGP